MKINNSSSIKKTNYRIGKLSDKEQLEFDIKDTLSRSAIERIKMGLFQMKMPVIDNMPYRIFETIQEYRLWADKNLPKWLGYSTTHD